MLLCWLTLVWLHAAAHRGHELECHHDICIVLSDHKEVQVTVP